LIKIQTSAIKINKNKGLIMIKCLLLIIAIVFIPVKAEEFSLPEEFSDFGLNRDISISYEDLDQLLELTVIDMGLSDRTILKPIVGNGTRLRSNRDRDTALEANRFYFEEVVKSDIKLGFKVIRQSLEKVPEEVPLNALTLDEQLAYWLNLYNTAIIEKLIEHYPVRNAKKLLEGENSILNDKFINVSGHTLSLNNIQHDIVFKKFGNKKIVMYGFYQGIIGSPNLRNEAYTADKVYKQLSGNAEEFVNSNRGVQVKRNRLNVSIFYDQAKILFPDFENDLLKHILNYSDSSINSQVEDSEELILAIEDWNVTDIYGTERSFGEGNATNKAALLNAVAANSNVPGAGAMNLSFLSDMLSSKVSSQSRFSPAVLDKINKLRLKKKINSSSVKIKDLPTK
jgi:hypothetical protein